MWRRRSHEQCKTSGVMTSDEYSSYRPNEAWFTGVLSLLLLVIMRVRLLGHSALITLIRNRETGERERMRKNRELFHREKWGFYSAACARMFCLVYPECVLLSPFDFVLDHSFTERSSRYTRHLWSSNFASHMYTSASLVSVVYFQLKHSYPIALLDWTGWKKKEWKKKSMTRAQLLRGPSGLKHEKHIQIIQLLHLTQCVTPLHCARCSGHRELIGQNC